MSTSSLPSQNAEDYPERICELIEEKGYARVVAEAVFEIAEK